MRNIAFIINPISGTQSKKRLPKMITDTLDRDRWLPNIEFTEYPGHARELAAQYARMGFHAVVAVGGDGTLNEVACGVRDTQTALGVIPMGSGNGFARHIGVPLRTQRAIEMINRSEVIQADYGLADDRLFVSTCGTGFDALIAYRFATTDVRGFQGYFKNVVKDLISYHPETYRIRTDRGEEIERKAFLITFANAGQWGYQAYIAPNASIQDGRMDICMLSSKAVIEAPIVALNLFTRTIDKNFFMDTVQARDIMLCRENASPFHIDGDPVDMPKDIRIRIVEDGLRVLVAKRF